eukprot:TRINITY_DN70828_c0_g1_i1.p1 TRINITY_DN70828_c0_g1~~TRINITY_DN70828_c0_g1_i1.p1  ORF type:complete len:1020 (+),score=220.84 TRINITY_DN70828_c0_g1_i1:104-3061(+)
MPRNIDAAQVYRDASAVEPLVYESAAAVPSYGSASSAARPPIETPMSRFGVVHQPHYWGEPDGSPNATLPATEGNPGQRIGRAQAHALPPGGTPYTTPAGDPSGWRRRMSCPVGGDGDSIQTWGAAPTAHRKQTLRTCRSLPLLRVRSLSLAKTRSDGIDLRMRAQRADRPGGHHDWAEDYRWTAVGERRSLRGLGSTLQHLWYRSQGWLAVVLTGVIMGTLGASVDIATLWTHQLTRGVCQAWWLPRIYCQPDPLSQNFTQYFIPWSEMFGYAGASWAETMDNVLYVVICCMMTTLACLLTKTFAPQAAGAGIPEIKAVLGGARIPKIGALRTLLVKYVGVVLAVGGNLSVGKAGPTVHLGFCVAQFVSRAFAKYRRSMGKRRELLTAGTAAGLCVAFGSPLGGVLYALEETASYFGPQSLYRCFVCSAVAAVTLQLWDPYRSNKLTLFSINYSASWDVYETPIFVLVGVLGGLVGVAFIKLHLFVARQRKKLQDEDGNTSTRICVLEVAVVTVCNCGLNWMLLTRSRTDAEDLQRIFRRCQHTAESYYTYSTECNETVRELAQLLVAKFLLTAVSFGMAVPGGFFMPCLVIGAAMGWCVGKLLSEFVADHQDWAFLSVCRHPNSLEGGACVLPAVYALVGAGAVLSGVTRMTISLVTIMFELTGGLQYVVPVTIGVLVAKWIAELVGGKDSIYSQLMAIKELEFLDPRVDTVEPPEAVAQAATTLGFDQGTMIMLYERQPLWQVVDALDHVDGLPELGFPVVKSPTDLRVMGFISRRRLIAALEDLAAELELYKRQARPAATVLFGDPELPPSTVSVPGEETVSVPGDGSHPSTPNSAAQGRMHDDDAYLLYGYVDPAPITVRSTIDVARVILIFRRLGVSSVLVVDENNRLQGWLSKADVIDHLRGKKAKEEVPGQAFTGGGMHSGFDQDELEEDKSNVKAYQQMHKRLAELRASAAMGDPPPASVLPQLHRLWKAEPSRGF